eukprot:9074632-Pyramimonas_sp.AAC.1
MEVVRMYITVSCLTCVCHEGCHVECASITPARWQEWHPQVQLPTSPPTRSLYCVPAGGQAGRPSTS